MKTFLTVGLVAIGTLAGITPDTAQAQQSPISFDDARQWRGNSVALSDDGAWYTVRYNLLDEPDKEEADSALVERVKAYYDDENQTDVLYIWNAADGLKYEIVDGENPVFSAESDWVAYQIKTEEGEEETTTIALKHLESGHTVRYESTASFSFLEEKNFFITTDAKSMLIYDLEQRTEHYIGNVGEYVTDKDSEYIAYTIASEDKRGNGIYLYNPEDKTTRSLITGSATFSNLAWNSDHSALAAYRYTLEDKEVDYETMDLLVLSGVGTSAMETAIYPVSEMDGMPENMNPAEKSGARTNAIVWSRDGQRLFFKLKRTEEGDADEEEAVDADESTVQVWHWRDKKLLSERIMEYDRKQNETFGAMYLRETNTVVQLTSEAVQQLVYSEGTDRWAIGMDNRKYISDWDVNTNDLYRVDLLTGERKLIMEAYRSQWRPDVNVAPDGEQALLWDGEHYWCYNFESDALQNITEGLSVSFVNQENDLYGFTPSYGFVGWVKDQNAVILNHKLDLWRVPIDGEGNAQNLTASVTDQDSVRFRLEDNSFAGEEAIADRYIDLSAQTFLYAFNTQTKHSGFFAIQNGELSELAFGPASYASPWRGYGLMKSKYSDRVVFRRGNYAEYPEMFLTNTDFRRPKKITDTNPQQESYAWGERILIDYTNDDGVPLQAILSIPDSYKRGQKLPMIVYSYEKMSSRMYRYPSPYLGGAVVPEMVYVSDGYLFLQPDIHFNVGTPHSDMHECIEAAIEKVIALGYVDEARIGYEGFSFGGHCGMYISTQENKFAAIAAGAGVSNLVQGFNLDIVRDGSNEQDYYMTGQGRLGTDPTSDTEMYIRESAVFNAHTMNTPLLLFHGTADKVVLWEHSFGFYSILRYLQKPVVFLSYRGEGHGLRQEANRLDIQRRLKEYFDHYLKGAEAKPWMKEELPYVPDEGEEENSSTPKWK